MAFSFSMRGIKELNWANRITLLRIGAILPILLFIHFPGRVTCWLAAVLWISWEENTSVSPSCLPLRP